MCHWVNKLRSTLSLPVYQAGFPHSQISHDDDLRDLEPDGEEATGQKVEQLQSRYATSTFWSHPTVPVRCSWQAILTLLLKSSFVWSDASFLKDWRKRVELRPFKLLEPEPADGADRFYLREPSDDSVPSDRRENTHGWYSDRHDGSGDTIPTDKNKMCLISKISH